MKPLRSTLAMAVLCLTGTFADAQQFSYEKELTSQQILNEMVANSKYRPKQVATLEAFELPLILDGRPAGSVQVKAGGLVNLVAVKPDYVVVEIQGNEKKLPIDKTDLISRYASRKKEVDRLAEEERLALLASGEEIWVAPPPVPMVAAAPEQVTKIVYIDSSEPRINVNNGNYWPYTSYYPTSYVVQPYYQYPQPPYCYRPQPVTPVCPPIYKPVVVGNPGTRYFPVNNTRQVLPPVTHPYAPARP